MRSSQRVVNPLNFPGDYKSLCTISTSDTQSKTFWNYFFESIHHFDTVDKMCILIWLTKCVPSSNVWMQCNSDVGASMYMTSFHKERL